MGDAWPKRQYYSLEEYEALVRDARPGERYEYVAGQIIKCEEYTTDSHNQIVLNCYQLLADFYYPKGCRVYTENVRLMIGEAAEFRLPDVLVTCSERDQTNRTEKRDPVILVEVLSPGTAMQDLAVKADTYRQIDSLQAYIIINPEMVWIRLYEKDAQGHWLPDRSFSSLEDMVTIPNLHLSVSIRELYRFVF